MKKTVKVFTSALAVLMLAGCTDAVAKLPDSSTELFKVGKKTVTKGDIYSMMNSSVGATTVITNAKKVIAQAEIEITDEMKETAQNSLDSYKTYYGDTFTTYLEQMGMTDQEYLEEYLIPSLQAEQLTSKYIEENYDDIAAKYSPVMATVLSFTENTQADKALSALKDGSKTAEEAAKEFEASGNGKSQIYTIESTDIDSTVRTVLNSSTPDDGWTLVPSSDGSAFVVLRVDDNDPQNFRDKAIETLKEVTSIANDGITYWFKKYGFVIYDKTIYDTVAADYADYLVQDIKDEAE